MISTIELFLDDRWQDVTSYLQRNNVVIQDRCDEAFATGSFQLRYSRNTNIPPYTPCRLNNSEYWFAKSTCRRYLTKKNYYIHNVELLELTAILSCYILGSKNFSVTGTNKKDYEKLKIIAALMEQKYGVKLSFEDYLTLDKDQEFTFGPGTTVFDAFTEIARSYDGIKVKVVSCNPSTNTYKIRFKLDDSEYHLDENRIVDEYYEQDTDSYGAILESEMTNVIDRTNTIKVSNLTLRADDFHMTADNSALILPTRCERIVDFGLNSGSVSPLSIVLGNEYKRKAMELGYIPDSEVNIGNRYNQSYEEWEEELKIDGYSPLLEIAQHIANKLKIDISKILASTWKPTFIPGGVDGSEYFYLKLVDTNEISSNASLQFLILPKDKWLLLEDREKPKYVYYESGSNRIEGLNNYYNDNFWSKVVGDTVYPFLNYIRNDGYSEELNLKNTSNKNDTPVVIRYKFNISSTDCIENSFYVEYYPIADICASSTKSVTPHNEGFVKSFSRSYDKTSNYIDFDRLINSLQRTNNMLGLPGGTIEYQMSLEEPVPKAFQHIIRDNIKWTITSVVQTISLGRNIATINLAYDYNKIAEAIGVKTQYNEVKNPLNSIIDRPFLWKEDCSGVAIYKECWVRLKIAGHILYKRAAVLEDKGIAYIYFEALDQYCFDKQAIHVNDENYMCKDVAYCDSNNEALNASISLGIIQQLTKEESFKLPEYDGPNFAEIIDLGTMMLYKDARERILFTLILKNCKVLPELKRIGFNPILAADIKAGSEGYDYFHYCIKNPNDAAVIATIKFIRSDETLYNPDPDSSPNPIKSVVLGANEKFEATFETQADLVKLEVSFRSESFDNRPSAVCQVQRK